MARRFRLTCARTTYFDLELIAEDASEAERLLEAVVAGNPRLYDDDRLIGKPLHRVVEIAACEELPAGVAPRAT